MGARLEAHDVEEFEWWVAYDALWPIGERRADIRSGILTSLIANIHRDAKKRREPYTIFDANPFLDKPEPQLLPATALLGQLRAYQAGYSAQQKVAS